MNQSWVFIFQTFLIAGDKISWNAVDPNSRYYNKTRSDWELRVSTTFNIVWPAPFYRGSSAPALRGPPRLCPGSLWPGRRRLTRLARAVRSSSTVMPYMAFISTQGLLFIHAADLHWRSCTEGADWSPVCSRDWGISGGCRILVTKSLNRWVWCLFSNYRKSIGCNETAITPL